MTAVEWLAEETLRGFGLRGQVYVLTGSRLVGTTESLEPPETCPVVASGWKPCVSPPERGCWHHGRRGHLCLPLLGDGTAAGVLYLAGPVPLRLRGGLEALAALTAAALDGRETARQAMDEAATDALTGLPNYRSFAVFCEDTLARAGRRGETVGLLMVDADHFKRINDDFGHEAGNMVLRRIAEAMSGSLRADDFPARYGGEELVAVCPGVSARGLFNVAERLRRTVEFMELAWEGRAVRVTVSVGVAAYPADASDVGGLVKAADAALYRAKEEGRNRVCGAPGILVLAKREGG